MKTIKTMVTTHVARAMAKAGSPNRSFVQPTTAMPAVTEAAGNVDYTQSDKNRSRSVRQSGLARGNGLIPSAVFDGFTAAQVNVIPAEYDETRPEFLAAIAAMKAVPALNTQSLSATDVAANDGTAVLTVSSTTPGVAIPGVRIEIGVGPFVQGIGQASVAIAGFPTSGAPPSPTDVAQSLAELLLAPVAGKICVARVLFGVPNLWGRRTRVPAFVGGASPVLYTPGAPPALPATAQAYAAPLTLNFSGLPPGTIVRTFGIAPGSPYFDADLASVLGARDA